MTTKSTSATAFVIGALAGGVAALLLAPESGSQLRRRIRNGAESAGGRLRNNAREKLESVTGTVKGAISEAKGTYKDEMERRRLDPSESIARKTGA